MEKKIANIDLKPLEALYLLSLGKEEVYSPENALICLITSLYQRQILIIVNGEICLSRRGQHIFNDRVCLDELERLVCWTINHGHDALLLHVMKRQKLSADLLRKNLVLGKISISLLLHAKKKYVLSVAGGLMLGQLISLREKVRCLHPGTRVDIVFPSLLDESDPNILAIKAYANQLIAADKEKSRAWILSGKQHL